jgi:hypothetical protein
MCLFIWVNWDKLPSSLIWKWGSAGVDIALSDEDEFKAQTLGIIVNN